MRIQFYPNDELEKFLVEEAEKRNVNVSALVEDILGKHYGLISDKQLTNIELQNLIFEEVADFVNELLAKEKYGEEFELYGASKTFRETTMVHLGKPSAVKARIGKAFNNEQVGKVEPFDKVEQVFLPNGKPKKSVGNRSSVYRIRKPIES